MTAGPAAAPPGCVLAVCGWSGSGKTTLLETVIPRLIAQGLRVAAVKHDAHGLAVDRPGKDSDRLFRAGADVALRGPGEALRRTHRGDADDLAATLDGLLADHDLVLVEGHKGTPLPKVWLASDGRPEPPPEVVAVRAVLPWDADRPKLFLAFVADWLAAAWRAVPLLGGVLIGGASSRMGVPKHLLRRGGTTFARARRGVALGRTWPGPCCSARVRFPRGSRRCRGWPIRPVWPDRLAGILAAMRWAPGHALGVRAPATCPSSTTAAVGWLLAERRPGRWAVMPSLAPGLGRAAARHLRAPGPLAARDARGRRAARPARARRPSEGRATPTPPAPPGPRLHQRQHPGRPRRPRPSLSDGWPAAARLAILGDDLRSATPTG